MFTGLFLTGSVGSTIDWDIGTLETNEPLAFDGLDTVVKAVYEPGLLCR